MKKVLNGIISILCGGVVYAMFALPFLTYTASSGLLGGSHTTGTNGYELIDFASKNNSQMAYSIFAVIVLVFAGLLVLGGIAQILKATKVVNTKISFAKFNVVLSIALTLFTIAMLICNITLTSSEGLSIGGVNIVSGKIGVGIGVIITVALAVLAVVLTFLTKKETTKSKKRK